MEKDIIRLVSCRSTPEMAIQPSPVMLKQLLLIYIFVALRQIGGYLTILHTENGHRKFKKNAARRRHVLDWSRISMIDVAKNPSPAAGIEALY